MEQYIAVDYCLATRGIMDANVFFSASFSCERNVFTAHNFCFDVSRSQPWYLGRIIMHFTAFKLIRAGLSVTEYQRWSTSPALVIASRSLTNAAFRVVGSSCGSNSTACPSFAFKIELFHRWCWAHFGFTLAKSRVLALPQKPTTALH